jgi:preprotein translocase subunit YajC
MWVTPAFAQDAAAPAATTGGSAMLFQLLPFVLIFVVMYFLIIRPQRNKMRQHQDMIRAVRRGDTIVTSGGLIGKIARVVDDNEIELEVGDKMRVRLARNAIAEVRAKGEPVKEEA